MAHWTFLAQAENETTAPGKGKMRLNSSFSRVLQQNAEAPPTDEMPSFSPKVSTLEEKVDRGGIPTPTLADVFFAKDRLPPPKKPSKPTSSK